VGVVFLTLNYATLIDLRRWENLQITWHSFAKSAGS